MASSWDRLFDQVAQPAEDFDALFDRVARPAARPAASEWERRGIFLVNKKTGEKKPYVPAGAEPGLSEPKKPTAQQIPAELLDALGLTGTDPRGVNRVYARVKEGVGRLADLPQAASSLVERFLPSGVTVKPGAREEAFGLPGLAGEVRKSVGREYAAAREQLQQQGLEEGSSPLSIATRDTAEEALSMAADPTNLLGAAGAARAARAVGGRAVPRLAGEVAAEAVSARAKGIPEELLDLIPGARSKADDLFFEPPAGFDDFVPFYEPPAYGDFAGTAARLDVEELAARSGRIGTDRLARETAAIGPPSAEDLARVSLGIGESKPVAKVAVRVLEEAAVGPHKSLVALAPDGREVGSLAYTAEPGGGFRVNLVTTEGRGTGAGRELMREAARRDGPFVGAASETAEGEAFFNRLRETDPDIFAAPKPAGEARAGEAGFVETEALRSLRRWTRENFTGAGRFRTAADDFSGQAEELVLSIPKRKEQMEAAHRAEMYKKDLLLQGLDKEVAQVAPTRAARRDLYRQMHQAAVGEIPVQQLPPALQPYVQKGSQLVDDLSDAMVREGAIPQPLHAVVAQNKGKYRHRAYQAFDDPTWGRRVEQGKVEGGAQRWDDAKRFLQAELPNATDEEVVGLMRQIADRPQGAEALALYSGSPSKINDVLKRRQNIPAPLRRLMGEYDDFRVSLDKTVHNLAWDLETHKMLRDLAAEGEPLGVFRQASAGPAGKLYQPVPGSDAVSGMSSRSPLADMLTTPGLRRALESELELAKTTWWQKLSGWTKAGKIVQNPAGIARNFLAHTLTTTANGRQALNPKLHLEVARWLRDPKLHEEAIRHNVLGQGFAAGEAEQYIKWIEASSEGPLAQGYNWVNRKMAKGFHGGDDYWKLYNWLGETRDQMWARGLSREEAMKLAADRVSDSFPTYSRAPEIVNKVRSMPLLGSPGATFGIESARVLKNNAKFAVLDIKEGLATGNPRLMALGAKRALGMAVGAAGVGAIAMRSRQESGMTLEQADALRRRVLPRYHQDSELVITSFEPGKSVSYVDLSFLNPFNAISKPLLAALRADREDAGAMPALVEVLETVLGGDIAAVGAFETLSGRRVESLYPPQAGPEIFSWDEPAAEIGKKMAYEGFENFAPGYLVQGERVLRGAGVLPSQLDSGREFKLGQEAVAIAGVRQSTYDIPRRLRGAVGEANGRLSTARSRLRSASRVGGLSEEEANVFLDDWTASYGELRATVADARLLGLSRAEIARITHEAGAIPAAVAFALSGRETPPPPALRPSTPEEGKAFRLLMQLYRQRYSAQPAEEVAP